MKDTAILITTFLRDNALFDCVRSIRRRYSDIAIYIADTGHENTAKANFCVNHNCTLIPLGFDAGVCMAKNAGLERIPKKYKYVFICEDDIIFTAKSKIEDLRKLLEARAKIGIAGCRLKRVSQNEIKDQSYEATLCIKDSTIRLEKIETPQWQKVEKIRYFPCDIVTNVFMMRRKIWEQIRWDERYKTTPEHTDYFLLLRHNTDWEVAFVDSVSLEHHAQFYKNHEYSAMRTRIDGYKLLGEKWGAKRYWNDWHKNWGINNPMGLYTYAKTRKTKKPVAKSIQNKSTKEAEVAIGIKTFMREGSLFKTLESIEKFFPFSYRLYIADDSAESISEEKEYLYQRLGSRGHEIIKLSFNSGISLGRNEIIQRAKEKYVLIMDDDIGLTDTISIKNMRRVLDSSNDIGLCAGMIHLENGGLFGGENYSKGLRFRIDRGALFRHRANGKINQVGNIQFNYADQVVNFFLAKRAVFKSVVWDNRIKVEYEHMDFFLNLKKTKWKAAVCFDTKLMHYHQFNLDPFYNRQRRNAPAHYFYEKHNIETIINRYIQEGGR